MTVARRALLLAWLALAGTAAACEDDAAFKLGAPVVGTSDGGGADAAPADATASPDGG